MKTVGSFRCTSYRDIARTGLPGYLVVTAYNLVRMAHLPPKPETAAGRAGPAAVSARPKGNPRGPNTDSAHPRGDRWHPKPVFQPPVRREFGPEHPVVQPL